MYNKLNKLNHMKILILGAFLLFSFTTQAQQFVSSDKARTIVADMTISDQDALDSVGDPTSEQYINKKHNLTSYYYLTKWLSSGNSVEVEEAIRRAVFKVAESKSVVISVDDYDKDNIIDDHLQLLKDHLITLLTQ